MTLDGAASRAKTQEPFRLTKWQLPECSAWHLYTCARPGRSGGRNSNVAAQTVIDWARGLPGTSDAAIISLLGKKPTGRSEFSFYSSFDDSRSFEKWLNANVANRKFSVVGHPTVDGQKVPAETLEFVSADVKRLLLEGTSTIVVVDSGGCARSSTVARSLGGHTPTSTFT